MYYTKLLHDKLKSKLSSTLDFVFKGDDETFIRLSVHYTREETKGGMGFSITSFKTVINQLIVKNYFNIGNVTMKQLNAISVESYLHHFGQVFFYFSIKKNGYHQYLFFIKLRQGTSIQLNPSLTIFAL